MSTAILNLPLDKYPRTPHLEGSNLQIGDDTDRVPYSHLRGKYIVVEEKLDGGNSGISFSPGADLLLQSRGHYLVGGSREAHFAPMKAWAHQLEDDLFGVLLDRYLMFGEWTYAHHTSYYDALPAYFHEFDVYDRVRQVYLSTPARRALLGKLPIWPVPVLYAGIAPKHLADLLALVKRSVYKTAQWRETMVRVATRLGHDVDRLLARVEKTDLSEGLYIKVEEGDQTVERFKYVRANFTQTILESDEHWLSRPILPNTLLVASDGLPPPPVWGSGLPLLDRSEFKRQVFDRAGGHCVFCPAPAVDAHHILDRGLFPDGGYYLENGAAVCAEHHLDCEEGRRTVAETAAAAGCRLRVLPPGLDPAKTYDKWGKEFRP